MSHPRDLLLAHLDHEREHVLACVDGLTEADLVRQVVPSGWTMAGLLSHLAHDDEIFWLGAVLAGDPESIAQVQDGWRAAPAGSAAAVPFYRESIARSRELLADVDLDAPPAWWPPPEVFPGAPFADGWQAVHRVLTETATHAGHLDIARELIDGHQHLVLD